MRTEICRIKPQQMDHSVMQAAGRLIASGALVAFPTETVYGLGGNALDPGAAARIYEAKGRPSDNPLIVHIADKKDLEQVAAEVPQQARRLAEAFWPGPLTMIVRKSSRVPYATTGGLDTVAVRMPDHPVALELIRCSGCPIAAPSANISGRPSPTEAAHVAEDLDGKIAMILDGGPVGIGIESTIIDLTEEKPAVLRPGYITTEMLSAVLGEEVQMDPGLLSAGGDVKPKAPGMKYRHYAPKAPLILVEGEAEAVVRRINELVKEQRVKGIRTAVLASEETQAQYLADAVLSIGSRENEETVARQLYRILRECDRLSAGIIYSEGFSSQGIGCAVMNRLLKAAGHQVIHV